MKTRGAFYLSGIDADGDPRESWHPSLLAAFSVAAACSFADADGPAWQCWEVWGTDANDQWACVASGKACAPLGSQAAAVLKELCR